MSAENNTNTQSVSAPVPTYENWNLDHVGDSYKVEHRLNRGTLSQLVYGMKTQCGGRTSEDESENALFGVMNTIVSEIVSRFNTMLSSFTTQEQRQFIGPLLFGRRDDGNIGSRINRAVPHDVTYSNSSLRRYTKALNGVINRLLRPSPKYLESLSPECSEWHTSFRTHLTTLSDYINVQIPLVWRPAVQAHRESHPKVYRQEREQQPKQEGQRQRRPYNREERQSRQQQYQQQGEQRQEGQQRRFGSKQRPRVFVKRQQEGEDNNGFQQVPRRFGGGNKFNRNGGGSRQQRAPVQTA